MKWIWMGLAITLAAHGEERYAISLRGQPQEVTLYRAAGKATAAVVFLPGDGGWRGFAVDMGKSLANAGFDVYGWDVKRYLSGFTTSRAALSENEMQRDIVTFGATLSKAGYRRVVMTGWSQGAAMVALAAASPDAKHCLAGVVLLGLPERGLLGWRFADNLSYITKSEPNEPTFAVANWLAAIAPVRFSMIQSTADEYIPLERAREMFGQAHEPKRFTAVTARNHRYDGNQEEFLRILTREVRWAETGE